ncbi:MAG TPA: hypothetical protein VKA13_02990 [Gammaproteobacteria bacterium]|nr:hypothetical protein [Gammaproteobacteria bacterium]
MTKTVISMKWGTRYSVDYANRLYSMVRRNLRGDLRFLCFTDDPAGLAPEIEAHPLPPIELPEPARWQGWRKISLFQHPLADLSGDVLFLDLDIVITGSLDEFFDYHPGRFCIIENWTQLGKGIGNTTAYRFVPGENTDIYERLMADTDRVLATYRASQQYVSACIPDMVFWPSQWCMSFKYHLVPSFPMNWFVAPRLPRDARLIAFTGKPDPDEAAVGHWPAPLHKRIHKHIRPAPWIAAHWR